MKKSLYVPILPFHADFALLAVDLAATVATATAATGGTAGRAAANGARCEVNFL